ncbi:conserved hypothetical protein [Cupriavidus necator]|uniref:PAAR domain-containing protein n=2 Tax=Cupriavidus necator TaxID=106590 RepID=A0A1K0JNS5_CUPNE|nr:conserved hypothetical protein [Cupriavidus necator]
MQAAETKKIYVAAFEGAKTAGGGEILRGSGKYTYEGNPLVTVGDMATYPDGTTAVIR